MTYSEILESEALTESFKQSTSPQHQRLYQALKELADLLDALNRLKIEQPPV